MEILGNISCDKNINLLNFSFDQEKKFNNPIIAYQWVKQRWLDNKEKYGEFLYEAETINFIDTDVFRQQAIRFLTTGEYCPFHPIYDKKEYDDFWDREDYRCRYGMTAYARLNDNKDYDLVHIPGRLYGFINYAIMYMLPRDDGNSFDKDKEELEYDKIEEISKSAKDRLNDFFDDIREVKTGEKTIGLPLFFDAQYHIAIAREFARNMGKNFFYGKARRKGQSYWNGWCAFHNYNFIPESTTIQAAYDKAYLTKGKGLFKMVKLYADHINKHTDWRKHRLKDTNEHIRSGYTYSGSNEEHGYKSEVIPVSAQNNPDVTIGKDCLEIQYEELGKFPNFDDSFGVTTSTAEAGDFKTGQLVGWGTAGTKEANWEAFERVVYNPNAYDALPCNNIWDEGADGTACCYFYPHVQSLEGHMDIYGNTNYESAWSSFKEQKEKKRKILDEERFTTWCGQRANSPAEAFSRNSNNIFDSDAIQAQIHLIIRNPDIKNAARYGRMIRSSAGVRLKTNEEIIADGGKAHAPVDDFPLTGKTDVHGCWIEWFPPYRDEHGKVPKNLYVAFQDPYAHDKEQKELTTRHSLGATYIFEQVNNITPFGGGIPVAAYVGRPPKLDDYNTQIMYGLEYYNAIMNFENNTGDTKSFFQRMKRLHYLMEEPDLEYLGDNSSRTGRGYGMNMNEKRKSKGAIYLRDMLNTSMGKDRITGKEMTLLNYIYDLGLLKELLKWSLKGNFDRVSAWLVGMFTIKQLEYEERKPVKAINNNSFFNRKLF